MKQFWQVIIDLIKECVNEQGLSLDINLNYSLKWKGPSFVVKETNQYWNMKQFKCHKNILNSYFKTTWLVEKKSCKTKTFTNLWLTKNPNRHNFKKQKCPYQFPNIKFSCSLELSKVYGFKWVIFVYFLDLSKFYDFKLSIYKYTSRNYDSSNNYFNTFSKK
jgi:hypothetical protein